MRKMLYRILCICMVLAMFAPAALAKMMSEIKIGGITYEYALEENNNSAYISHVDGDTCGQSLDIPREITVLEAGMGVDVPVRGIREDAFEECNRLKYVRLGFDRNDGMKQLADGSLDFSSAENLEIIYLNFGITQDNEDEIRRKFKFPEGSSVRLLQYCDLGSEEIRRLEGKYENGNVVLSFENVIPDGYGDAGYTVLRYEAGQHEAEETFSTAFDAAAYRFAMGNGIVTFTDNSVTPGKTYIYAVCAWNAFSRTPHCKVEVSIPAPVVPQPDAEPEPLPETGDGADIVLWLGMMAAGAIALACSRKRKYN